MRYYRFRSDSGYRPSFGGMSFLPPVMRFLLFANVGIFLLEMFFGDVIVGGDRLRDLILEYGALWPVDSGLFHVWQLVTYMFLHSGFGHVFFNMFALWMFGLELEQVWGSRHFGLYYLIAGLGGGLSQLFIAPLFAPAAPTVGASGAIFGILLAFGLMFPDRPIYFYFLFPIPAKYFVIGYVLLEIFAISGPSNVAHLAHLGGAAAGLIFLLVEDKLPLDRWLDSLIALFRRTPGVVHGGLSERPRRTTTMDARFQDVTAPHTGADQEIIDRILDKISKSGYQNLTEEEKKVLFEASKNMG
jgi:membrane associated rhomboid family serine protease